MKAQADKSVDLATAQAFTCAVRPLKVASTRLPKCCKHRFGVKRRGNAMLAGGGKRGPKTRPKKRPQVDDRCIYSYNQRSPFSGLFFRTAFFVVFRLMPDGIWFRCRHLRCGGGTSLSCQRALVTRQRYGQAWMNLASVCHHSSSLVWWSCRPA